jgi:hypothetical protein
MKATRSNVIRLFIGIFIFDFSFFLLSNLLISNQIFPEYKISDDIFYYSIIYCLFFLLILLFVYFFSLIPPLNKFKINHRWVKILVLATIVIQILHSLYISVDARYVSGSLTGASGILYGFSKSMTIASILMMIKYRKYFYSLGPLIISFIFTNLLTIDGFSSALVLFLFLYIFYIESIEKSMSSRILLITIFGPVAAIVLYGIGFNAKFVLGFDIGLEENVFWAIHRFAIQPHSFILYLSGESIIQGPFELFQIISQSFSDRADILLGDQTFISYPRNLSEAVYYDLFASYGSGSSPGLLYFLAISSIFMPIILLLLVIILSNYFDTEKRYSLPSLIMIGFILKFILSDLSEVITIISPSFVGFILIASLSLVEFTDQKDG